MAALTASGEMAAGSPLVDQIRPAHERKVRGISEADMMNLRKRRSASGLPTQLSWCIIIYKIQKTIIEV